ncbi:hypothetical protein [Metapseudomonas furukawaii]
MPSKVVLISRFKFSPRFKGEIFADLISSDRVRYYLDYDEMELLQLRAYDDLADFSGDEYELEADVERFREYMSADVVRELLMHVESPKPCDSKLPDTDYIQLRHVEVLPEKYSEYRQWRADTIFQVVKESVAVEVFLAYHSMVSGQPGVMFIAGFSGDPAEYQEVFETDRYREIVRQAGSNYITGGMDGLYTRNYSRLTF